MPWAQATRCCAHNAMLNSKGIHLSTQRRRLQDEEGGLPTIRKTHTPSIHQVTVADVTCKSSSHQCGAESSHRMHSHIGRLSTESHVSILSEHTAGTRRSHRVNITVSKDWMKSALTICTSCKSMQGIRKSQQPIRRSGQDIWHTPRVCTISHKGGLQPTGQSWQKLWSWYETWRSSL